MQNKVEYVRNLLGFEGIFVVEAQGHSRGIAFYGKNKEEASLNSFGKIHIDFTITVHGWKKFRLTGLYGEPDLAKRRETWQLIRNLSATTDLPWCLIGDMNNVLSKTDKREGRLFVSELAYTGFLRSTG